MDDDCPRQTVVAVLHNCLAGLEAFRVTRFVGTYPMDSMSNHDNATRLRDGFLSDFRKGAGIWVESNGQNTQAMRCHDDVQCSPLSTSG